MASIKLISHANCITIDSTYYIPKKTCLVDIDNDTISLYYNRILLTKAPWTEYSNNGTPFNTKADLETWFETNLY